MCEEVVAFAVAIEEGWALILSVEAELKYSL